MKIEKICIKRMYDDNPDLSFLESKVKNGIIDSCCFTQEDYNKNPEEIEKYIKQDRERLENYGRTWGMIGIQAEATVSYPMENGSRRLEFFTSGGLWGIEDDCNGSYLEEVEKEELQNLKEHLQKFDIPIDNFESKIEEGQ